MKRFRLVLTAFLMAVSVAAFAQKTITVTGTVKDASTGEPLSGAAVLIKGTPQGVVADADGRYSVNVAPDGTLGFTTIGFKEAEVAVNGRSVIDVALDPDITVLDETIVIAYGTATRSSFTGSASMVKSEAIEKNVSTNATSALAGTTSGVQIISSNGDPTKNTPTIRIRGIGSISAGTSPLIVVDGVPYSNDFSLNDINPNDIESMSVLKDASASAIYGHRGANGVILITTKKGSGQDAVVKFDARLGSNSRLIPQYDVIDNPAQYYETYYQRMYNRYYYSGHTAEESYNYADQNLFNEKNGGLGYQVYTIPEGEKFIGTNFKLNPKATLGYTDGEYYYTPDDWYNETFHNSFRQEYNLSVSGSSNRFNYYTSAGYVNDGGIIANSGYKRFTGRVNAEYQAKEWFRIITNLNYSHGDSQSNSSNGSWGSSGNVFFVANNMGPIYPLYVRNADGSIRKDDNGNVVFDSNNTNFIRPAVVGNAIRDNLYDSYKNLSDQVNAKGGVVLTPVKGLTISGNVGVTANNSRATLLSSIFGSAAAVDGDARVESDRIFTVNQQYLAEYKNTFGKNSIDVLAGYEQYNYTGSVLYGENDHLFNPLVGELSNADGTSRKVAKSYTNKYMTEGFLARAQYDYDGKYFLSGSYRRDASSHFAPEHRWGNFWSAGGAWLISKEDFLKDADAVDLLKLKVSYGEQGNDDIGTYPYSDQYVHSYNESTGEYSISLSYKGNRELTWEKSKSFNVGADFELFHGYLNGSVEWFLRNTSDLLYNKNVPYSSGNPTGVYPVNVGSIRNMGVDVELNGKIIRNKNVDWTWNINLSQFKNTITSLDPSVSENGIRTSYYIREVGGSLYDAYMFKFAGVDPETGQALYWQHKDEEKDDAGNVTKPAEDVKTTVFSDATQYKLGSILPKVYGGFGTALSLYGVDFSVQFSYQLGGRFYDGSYQQLMWTQDNAGQAWHKDILKAWTPDNRNTDIPRNDGDIQVSQSAVDRFLISSNYLSLNNATLGYTFPSKWTRKFKVNSLRIYAAGENLFVLSARKGLDPRYSTGLGMMTSGSGIATSSYSAMRTITGGLSVSF